jgi:sulfur-carrier protein
MAQVLYLGKLGDLAGLPSETFSLPPDISNAGALRIWLDETRGFGGALKHRTVRVAVNAVIVADSYAITDSDEVAFLPPVGGG